MVRLVAGGLVEWVGFGLELGDWTETCRARRDILGGHLTKR